MAEAIPDSGPSLLSTADAVTELLQRNAPPADTVLNEEATVEDPQEDATELEADAEPEAEAPETEEAEGEEIGNDESEPEAEPVPVEDPAPLTYRVSTPDGEVDVTVDELKNSYMRQADYTRKTQQVSEDRKVVESEIEHVQGERIRYAQGLEQLEQALSQTEPDQSYWDDLYKQNPLEYTRQRDQMRDRKDALEQVKSEQAKVQNEQIQAMQKQSQQHLSEQHALLPELIPEWRDPEIMMKEKKEIFSHATQYGFSDKELNGISDSRAVSVLRKAYLFDQLMEKKPVAQKRTKQAPKMTKPGQPKTKAQVSQKRRRQSLANVSKNKRSKSIDAAVEYMLQK